MITDRLAEWFRKQLPLTDTGERPAATPGVGNLFSDEELARLEQLASGLEKGEPPPSP